MPLSVNARRRVQYLCFCAATFVLGFGALEIAPHKWGVAAWWPAAGVTVAVIALNYRRRWAYAAIVVLASGLANLAGGRPLAVALGFGFANAAEGLVAAAVLTRRHPGRPALESIADVWHLVVAAVLGGLSIAAGVAFTVELFADGEAMLAVRNVIPSHVTAVLLITPFALSTAPVIRRRPIERGFLWFASIAVVLIVFWPGQSWPLSYLVIATVMWTSVRLGLRETAAQLIVIGVLVTALTRRGGGPFNVTAASEQLAASTTVMLIQLFIATSAVVLLPLTIALAEREAAIGRFRASEVLFRAGFSEAIVGMLLLRVERTGVRVVEANSASETLLGVRRHELFSSDLRASDGRSLDRIAAELAPGSGWRAEMVSHRDGHRWFNVAIALLSEPANPRIAAVQIVETTAAHLVKAELAQMALHDHLTGLPNRAAFADRLSVELAASARTGASLAVMFLDIDDFKLVNDASGHVAGDSVLVALADRLRSVMRTDDVVARIGGDEFVLLCPGAGTPEVALALAERIWAVTERPIDVGDTLYEVSLSVGVTLSRPESTPEQLLNEADLALYAAKSAGKRRITLYSDDLGELAASRVRIESELRAAVRCSQFEMYMQPVVEIATGRINAAEALIRWNHPGDGLLAPAGWLDVAERAGLMPELGAWVLDDSVRQAASWIDLVGVGSAPVVHVNVSARQLDAPGFAAIVLETIGRHRLPPDKLVLELTETHLAQVSAGLVAELESLARIGIRIAADDYGTGYSPLTRIVELPISMIKIDRQFVSSIGHDPRSLGIVGSLLQLASTLELDVVAEGVETMAQLEILRSLGCTAAQGYFWSPAVSPIAFMHLLADRATARMSPGRVADIRSMYLG